MSTPGILGQSLPGWWRPFLSTSPWNMLIPSSVRKHALSDRIIAYMSGVSAKLAMAREFVIPLWIIDHTKIPKVKIRSKIVHDFFREGDYTRPAPWHPDMWAEQTADGHISIIDPALNYAWEMSRFKPGPPPECTTYNEWALRLNGYGHPHEGERWWARGGRAAGFPNIAGQIRPEQIEETREIKHALVFTFPNCRKHSSGAKIFMYPPACRSDGEADGAQYPIQGMRFQLDPTADEKDFDDWKLPEPARIVARTLQERGMFLGDNGGALKLQLQGLAKNKDEHKAIWDRRCPGLYSGIEGIPTNRLRVVETVEPTVKEG